MSGTVESMAQGVINLLGGDVGALATDAELAAVADAAATDDAEQGAELADLVAALPGQQFLYAQVIGNDGTTVATGANPLSFPQGTGVTMKWHEWGVAGTDIEIDGTDKAKVKLARAGVYVALFNLAVGVGGFHNSAVVTAYPEAALNMQGQLIQQQQDCDGGSSSSNDHTFPFLLRATGDNASIKFGGKYTYGNATEQGYDCFLTVARIA